MANKGHHVVDLLLN